jgi:hypothetical protein
LSGAPGLIRKLVYILLRVGRSALRSASSIDQAGGGKISQFRAFGLVGQQLAFLESSGREGLLLAACPLLERVQRVGSHVLLK